MAQNIDGVEYQEGQVVELVEPVSLLYRRKPLPVEMIFLPGTRGKVVPCPVGLEGFLMIDIDGFPLVVRPDQVRCTGEMDVWMVVSEEEIEQE